MNPLSHHEIMALVGPYSRAGCVLDLPASDRAARRLRFKPVDHPVGDAESPACTETLELANPAAGSWRLQRTLALPEGLCATLTAHGEDPALLLQAVQAVPPGRQLRTVAGHGLALSHSVVPDSGRLTLSEAQARIGNARLDVTVSRVKGIPAELSLGLPTVAAQLQGPAGSGPTRADAGPADPPEDLLAVLGLAWSRLRPAPTAGTAGLAVWRAHLSLRGFDAERTRDAEAKLERTVRHLARTLAEPPALFHAHHVRARWFVVLRRLTPLLVGLTLLAVAAAVPQLELEPDSVWRMLIFNSPPLLLVWLFSMREMPSWDLPRWPRASRASTWLGAGSAPAPAPAATAAASPPPASTTVTAYTGPAAADAPPTASPGL